MSEAREPEPNVSVIIPTYNRAEDLPRAVASVLEQTRPVLEIIIADNGRKATPRAGVRCWKGDGLGSHSLHRCCHQTPRAKPLTLGRLLLRRASISVPPCDGTSVRC